MLQIYWGGKKITHETAILDYEIQLMISGSQSQNAKGNVMHTDNLDLQTANFIRVK